MFDDHAAKKLCYRLAVEGEELVAHRFQGGLIGMVGRADFERWRSSVASATRETLSIAPNLRKGIWQTIRKFCVEFLTYYGFVDFGEPSAKGEPGPVVGIPSEALLRVFGISAAWQQQYQLGSFADALFIELATASGRRALYFGNGVLIPLRLLREGQKVKVLRRSWPASLETEPEPVQTTPSSFDAPQRAR